MCQACIIKDFLPEGKLSQNQMHIAIFLKKKIVIFSVYFIIKI